MASRRLHQWLQAGGWLTLVLTFCVMAEGLQLSDIALDRVQSKYGAEARGRVEDLRRLMDQHSMDQEQDKLEQVNNFFNLVPYGEDSRVWKKNDYWATPIEMLGVDGADCEDYAIAKYFTLREMGVPSERLRITYVKAVDLNQAHMVLAYYPQPDAEPVILDNIDADIRPASQREDLIPVYSFNGENLWLSVTRSRGEKAGKSSRIKLWNRLKEKMGKELALDDSAKGGK